MKTLWFRFWAWYHRVISRIENWIAREMGLGAFYDTWGEDEH